MLTLLANHSDVLFRPAGLMSGTTNQFIPISNISLFSLVPDVHLEIGRWAAIVILAIVVVGWRPSMTGVLHWWISFSFATSCLVPDGGDHVAAVLTLLLVPVTVTDRRKWHWSRIFECRHAATVDHVFGEIARSSLFVIRIQVAIIYFSAAVSKFSVVEWLNGTAAYYWFTHPVFGSAGWVRTVLLPAMINPVSVVAVTWGAIVLEIMLSLAIALRTREGWWQPLLVAGLMFHLAILVVHGLVSFFFSMAGALVLYLVPVEGRLQLPIVRAKSEISCGDGEHGSG